MYDKAFFEKVFSQKRMERYYQAHSDETRAVLHYQCNTELAESFYTCLSVFEVALRNAICRQLEIRTGRKDWYILFLTTPGLVKLNRYITFANKQIADRHEIVTPDKIIAELTLGFWVSLFNSEYEKILWKDLRKAFPYMAKSIRQRKNISAPLNILRTFRNRIFHNESICWNLNRVEQIHENIILVLKWIDKDLADWILTFDRFPTVINEIKAKMNWK